MMVAARTSETSVDIQLRTRQYIPEDSELHTVTAGPSKQRCNDIILFAPTHVSNPKPIN
jgi:hypothetical protein